MTEIRARVLIVVPSLGARPQYLAQTLESITSQADVQLHLVAVLPRSAESARRIAIAAGAEIVDDPGGLSAAINAGLSRADPADIYANWLGDDDLLAPDALATCARALDEDPASVVAFGYCDYIDGGGRVLATSRAGRLAPWLMTWGPDLVPQPGMLFRLSALQEVGGLDPGLAYAMDLDLLLRLRRAGGLVNVRRRVSAFRWHAESTTVANRESSLSESELVKRRYLSSTQLSWAWLWERPVRIATRMAVARLNSRVARAARPRDRFARTTRT